nr:hypothetical protein [uncultured Lactobacillus sp.]
MYQNYITAQMALTLSLDFTIPNNHLAKTKSGRQRRVRYNPNWQYLKEKAKNKQKKTVKKLKLRVRLIVFWHLGVSFSRHVLII